MDRNNLLRKESYPMSEPKPSLDVFTEESSHITPSQFTEDLFETENSSIRKLPLSKLIPNLFPDADQEKDTTPEEEFSTCSFSNTQSQELASLSVHDLIQNDLECLTTIDDLVLEGHSG